MRTRLLRGRVFSGLDTPDSPKVAIVNQSMARQSWPHSSAIGKGFRWGGRPFQVAGIVEDVHAKAIDQPVKPAIYFSAWQMETHTLSSGVFLMRTSRSVPLAELIPALRRTVGSVDGAVPILGFSTLHQIVDSSLATRRASLLLAGSFALLALTLALAGIYSLFSQSIAQRTREIGVRLALGAQPAGIRRLVLTEAARLIAWGLAAGTLLATLTARFLASFLFAVSLSDPTPYLISILGLLAVALLGIYAPARRASRVDPLNSLRED